MNIITHFCVYCKQISLFYINFTYFYVIRVFLHENVQNFAKGKDMKAGDCIKYWRTELKLSQQKLAEMIGSNQQAISRWEANVNVPNINDCFKIARALQLSLDEIFGDLDV